MLVGGGGGISIGQASEPVRVLLSLFAALAVGIAEILIYAIYWGKVSAARGKESKVRERKVVIARDEVGGRQGTKGQEGHEQTTVSIPGQSTNHATGNKEGGEMIWGKGVNGGVRRRVREKWEEKELERENSKSDLAAG